MIEILDWSRRSYISDLNIISGSANYKLDDTSTAIITVASKACRKTILPISNFVRIVDKNFRWFGVIINLLDNGTVTTIQAQDISVFLSRTDISAQTLSGELSQVATNIYSQVFYDGYVQYDAINTGVDYERITQGGFIYYKDVMDDLEKLGLDWFIIDDTLYLRPAKVDTAKVNINLDVNDFDISPSLEYRGNLQADRIIVNGDTQTVVENTINNYGVGVFLKKKLTRIFTNSNLKGSIDSYAQSRLQAYQYPVFLNIDSSIGIRDACTIDRKLLVPSTTVALTGYNFNLPYIPYFKISEVNYDFLSEKYSISLEPLGETNENE